MKRHIRERIEAAPAVRRNLRRRKLTDRQREAIRTAPGSARSVAARFGVDHATVLTIRKTTPENPARIAA